MTTTPNAWQSATTSTSTMTLATTGVQIGFSQNRMLFSSDVSQRPHRCQVEQMISALTRWAAVRGSVRKTTGHITRNQERILLSVLAKFHLPSAWLRRASRTLIASGTVHGTKRQDWGCQLFIFTSSTRCINEGYTRCQIKENHSKRSGKAAEGHGGCRKAEATAV